MSSNRQAWPPRPFPPQSGAGTMLRPGAVTGEGPTATGAAANQRLMSRISYTGKWASCPPTTLAEVDASLVLAKLLRHQSRERVEGRLGIGAVGLDEDAGAGMGGEHHQPHDRGGRHLLAVAGDRNVGIELLGAFHEFGRGAG